MKNKKLKSVTLTVAALAVLILVGLAIKHFTGWSEFTNTDLNVSFSYPTKATVAENKMTKEDQEQLGHRIAVGSTTSITLKDTGYLMVFHTGGTDAPEGPEYSNPKYEVSGHEAKAWEKSIDGAHNLLIAIPGCNDLNIGVTSDASSQETVDRILASVKCGT